MQVSTSCSGRRSGQVVEHVVGRDQRQPGCVGERGETGEAARIVAAIEMVGGEIGAAGEIRRDPGGKVRRIHPTDRLPRAAAATTIWPSPCATTSA